MIDRSYIGMWLSSLMRTISKSAFSKVTVHAKDLKIRRKVMSDYPTIKSGSTTNLFMVPSSTTINMVYSQELKKRFSTASTFRWISCIMLKNLQLQSLGISFMSFNLQLMSFGSQSVFGTSFPIGHSSSSRSLIFVRHVDTHRTYIPSYIKRTWFVCSQEN